MIGVLRAPAQMGPLAILRSSLLQNNAVLGS